MVKINRKLLPIKVHFFFFFAALGPLLPQMNVYGRQLGISPGVMGLVTSVLPLLWAVAKPSFGYLVDYFTNHRKLIFMLLISVMTGSYVSLWFLPTPGEPIISKINQFAQISTTEIVNIQNIDIKNRLGAIRNFTRHECISKCPNTTNYKLINLEFVNIGLIETFYTNLNINYTSCMDYGMTSMENLTNQNVLQCHINDGCVLFCRVSDNDIKNLTAFSVNDTNVTNSSKLDDVIKNINDASVFELNATNDYAWKDLYGTFTFWGFVIFMCIGTVAFNVANCIGDAVCFDMLGSGAERKYGAQRAWGTVGYGIAALFGGWLVDRVSSPHWKDFTPAFVMAMGFTAVDLVSCRQLRLPSLTSPADSKGALRKVLTCKRVIIFICFAVVAGVFDSFIIYYMFWFLEELAEETGDMANIKLLEGLIVAAQSFGGELLFFFLSGPILKRWGYGRIMSICLLCYGIRMALISLITNPWHLLPLEAIMQGPTYALTYATIVGYAATVAPEGFSATVQGIVAGMDDGLGFAIGSLIGGQLYSAVGGRNAHRIFALVAVSAAVLHAVLHATVLRNNPDEKATCQYTNSSGDFPRSPEEGRMLPVCSPGQGDGAIYCDTVLPVKADNHTTSLAQKL